MLRHPPTLLRAGSSDSRKSETEEKHHQILIMGLFSWLALCGLIVAALTANIASREPNLFGYLPPDEELGVLKGKLMTTIGRERSVLKE